MKPRKLRRLWRKARRRPPMSKPRANRNRQLQVTAIYRTPKPKKKMKARRSSPQANNFKRIDQSASAAFTAEPPPGCVFHEVAQTQACVSCVTEKHRRRSRLHT